MRKRIVNKVASPYDIETANGPAIIGALGEIEADFTDEQIEQMTATGFYEISDVAAKPQAKAAKAEEKPQKK